mgnify:FL=1|tara:strand:+ start:1191 stop:1472 length:282 start_codon:yes stop_codon:yes gene_type:complete
MRDSNRKQDLRAELEEHIKTFEENGGRITRIPVGYFADPFILSTKSFPPKEVLSKTITGTVSGTRPTFGKNGFGGRGQAIKGSKNGIKITKKE